MLKYLFMLWYTNSLESGFYLNTSLRCLLCRRNIYSVRS